MGRWLRSLWERHLERERILHDEAVAYQAYMERQRKAARESRLAGPPCDSCGYGKCIYDPHCGSLEGEVR